MASPITVPLFDDSPVATDSPADDQPSEFGKGLRSSFSSAKGQVLADAARVAETAGYGNAAQGLYANSAQAQADAAASAPRVSSASDVHSAGDAIDYGMGLLGQSALPAAVGIAGGLAGKGTLGRLAGATLATAPFTIGSQVQAQQADPVQAAASLGQRNAEAIGTGGADAAIMNVVPQVIGGKIVGGLAERMAGRGAGTVLAKNLAEGVGGNAAAGAASAELGQASASRLNPGRDTSNDDAEAMEGAASGAVGGLVPALLGGAGEVAHTKFTLPKNAIDLDALKAGTPGTPPAAEPTAPAAPAAPSVADSARAAVQRVKDIVAGTKAVPTDLDAAHELASGGDLVDDDKLKTAAPDAQPAIIADGKQTALDKVTGWAKDLYADSDNLTDDAKAKLDAAATNLNDKGNQAVVAGLKIAQDGVQKAKDLGSDLSAAFRRTPDGSMRSEADDGGRRAVASALSEITGDSQQADILAPGIAAAIDHAETTGSLPQAGMRALTASLGDDARSTLQSVQAHVSGSDKAANDNFHTAMLQLDEHTFAESSLRDTVQASLDPTIRDRVSPEVLQSLTQGIQDYVAGKHTARMGQAEATLHNTDMRRALISAFGDKTDAVIARFAQDGERTAPKLTSDRAFGEKGEPLEPTQSEAEARDREAQSPDRLGEEHTFDAADDTETRYYGGGKDKKAPEYMEKPDVHRAKYGNPSQAERVLGDVKAANSEHDVRLISAREHAEAVAKAKGEPVDEAALLKATDGRPNDHVIVEATKQKQPGTMTKAEVDSVRLDTDKYPDHKSRIGPPDTEGKVDKKTGEVKYAKTERGNSFDAVKLTEHMKKTLGYTESDEQGGMQRTARAFHEGVAALTDYTGKRVAFDHDTVIDRKGTTVGDLDKVSMRPKDPAWMKGKTDEEINTELSQRENLSNRGTAGPSPYGKGEDEKTTRSTFVGGMTDSEVKRTVNTLEIRNEDAAQKQIDALKDTGVRLTKDNVGAIYKAQRETPIGKALKLAAGELAKREKADTINFQGDAHGGLPVGKLESREIEAKIVSLEKKLADAPKAQQGEIRSQINRLEAQHAEALGRADQSRATTKDETGSGRTAADLEGNIHAAAASGEPITRYGNKLSTEGALLKQDNTISRLGRDNLAAKASELSAGKTATNRALGTKLRGLIARLDDMKPAEQQGLLRAVQSKPGEKIDVIKASEKINELAKKYPADQAKMGPPPKTEAAKKKAFVDRVNKGDTKDILNRVADSTDELGLRDAGKSLYDAAEHSEHAKEVLDAINNRLDEITHDDPSKQYSLQLLHASPHTFEKFDWASNLGRGEGAQAFGYGGYFASSKDVAAFYKDKFTGPDRPKLPRTFYDHTIAVLKKFNRLDILNIPERAEGVERFEPGAFPRYEALKEFLKHNDVPDPYAGQGTRPSVDQEATRMVRSLEGSTGYDPTKKAPLYNVEAKIDPHEILDYDKPLKDQPRELIDKLYDNPVTDAAVERLFKDNSAPTGKDLYEELTDSHTGSDKATSELLDSIGIKGHKYLDGFGRKKGDGDHNYVIYDAKHVDIKGVEYNKQAATSPTEMTPQQRQQFEDYITKTLGPSVDVQFAKLLHGGEFQKADKSKFPNAKDVIRASVYALDPMSVAAHEASHAFFSQLRDSGDHAINRVLWTAVDGHVIRSQLREYLKNSPEALKQIENSAEERAAYAFQMHQLGLLKVGPKTDGVFAKIGQFLRSVLGIWTNDERATHIMDYFQSGEYAKNIGDRSALEAAFNQGTNKHVEALLKATKPLRELAATVASTGESRLRDTQIPALTKLADLIHSPTSRDATSGDTGFISASRETYTRNINDLSKRLAPYNVDRLNEALESLQSGKPAATPEAAAAAKEIKKTLDQQFEYMRAAGVNVGDLGYGKDYFPRIWDTSNITSNLDDFKAMLQKYKDTSEPGLDINGVVARLIRNGGAELGNERVSPGMQHSKERVLSFIKPEDAARFLNKDLYGTMNSYLAQASKKAEWVRRFGNDNEVIDQHLKDAAKDGATPDQIATAKKYLNGVNGTLGDNISPSTRRLFSNTLVYQNVRLLSLGIFSSAPDAAGIFVRGGTVSDAFSAFKRGIAEIPRGFKDPANRKDDPAYKLSEDLGVIDSAMLQHVVGSAYSQDLSGFSKKINEGMFKYNLMDQYNRSMRVGATVAAARFLARHADGTASTHSARWLSELGLKPGDVVVKNGDALLTEQDFRDHGYSGVDAEAKSIQMAKAVNKWVDGAILRPNAAQKPIYFNDPHFALISHLKQFVFSFQENILKRVVNEAKHGNYSPALGLASYIPIMIAADAAKGIIQGGGSQPNWKEGWDAGDYLWSGVQRAGLLGVTQFAADAVGHKSGLLGFLGPTAEQIGDGISTIGGRERFGDFAMKSLPANALATPLLASKGGAGPVETNSAD